MDITYDELDLLINSISLGRELLYLDNEFIIIEYPSNELKVRANLVKKHAYNQALKDGLLAKEDLEKLVVERGLFSAADEERVKKLQSRLEAQEQLLAKTLKVKANQDRIRKVIKELKEEIAVTLFKKYSKLNMSADVKANEEYSNYLCSECVYYDDGRKYWPDLNAFLRHPDVDTKNEIFSQFIDLLNGRDMAVIRYIARSTLWRIKYTASMKTSEALFGRPVSMYTQDQVNMLYWANFYDQIYNMMPSDRPSDEVIQDDELLDKFMEEYYKEMNNETSILRERKVKNKGALSAFDAEEVIVTQSNELYLDIEYDKPREARKLANRESTDIKADAKKIKLDTAATRQSQGRRA